MTDTDIHLLLTGDELMSGDTIDSNSAMIAQALAVQGQTIAEKITLGDDRERLVAALKRTTDNAGVMVMNGGLGPTQDDLTAELVAAAAGVPLALNPEAEKHVRDWCAARSIEPNDANLKQAWLPEGAAIIHNPRGSAVGFALQVNKTLILTTPGVPGELRAMLPEVCERITEAIGGGAVHRVRLQTFGIGESTAQALIDEDPRNVAGRRGTGLSRRHTATRNQTHQRFAITRRGALSGDAGATDRGSHSWRGRHLRSREPCKKRFGPKGKKWWRPSPAPAG
jgi:molybdenum cofactor synthesis domain-containing protein